MTSEQDLEGFDIPDLVDQPDQPDQPESLGQLEEPDHYDHNPGYEQRSQGPASSNPSQSTINKPLPNVSSQISDNLNQAIEHIGAGQFEKAHRQLDRAAIRTERLEAQPGRNEMSDGPRHFKARLDRLRIGIGIAQARQCVVDGNFPDVKSQLTVVKGQLATLRAKNEEQEAPSEEVQKEKHLTKMVLAVEHLEVNHKLDILGIAREVSARAVSGSAES